MLCEYYERKRSFFSEAKILSLQAQAKAQSNCKEKSRPTTEKQVCLKREISSRSLSGTRCCRSRQFAVPLKWNMQKK